MNGRGAAGSAAGQQVAYLGTDNEIHLLDLRSGRSKAVTTGGEAKRGLAWSPDGSQVAYLVGEGERSRIGLYTVATGVTEELPGKGTAGVSDFAWAPDGGLLAFALWQGVERRVYRINADGSGLQQLTHIDSWSPAWSADGRTLVVSSAQGLQRLDSQGRTVTTLSSVAGEEPSWSADGKWLAYLTRDAASGQQTLWLLDVASGQAEAVAGAPVARRRCSTCGLSPPPPNPPWLPRSTTPSSSGQNNDKPGFCRKPGLSLSGVVIYQLLLRHPIHRRFHESHTSSLAAAVVHSSLFVAGNANCWRALANALDAANHPVTNCDRNHPTYPPAGQSAGGRCSC
ncbi:MAG: hypothetical protein DYG89_35835 [Caldilinea sp. CFX5]|nr:hypothetical protein [Caldilinea sp. CFX5]